MAATWSSSNGLLRGEELTWDSGGEAEYLEGLKAAGDDILFSELNRRAC
jgi:hypothetical protein